MTIEAASNSVPLGFSTATQLLSQRLKTSKHLPMGFITASELLAQRIESSKRLPVGFITASQYHAQRIEASKLLPEGFITASQYLLQRIETFQTTPELRELDKILEGGVKTRSVSKTDGEIVSGNTQCCHPLCGTCQLALDQVGDVGKAMYIDTEGTFKRQRLLQTAERSGMEGAFSIGREVMPYQSTEDLSSAVSPTSTVTTYLPDLPKQIWVEIFLTAALPFKTLVNLTTIKCWKLAITDLSFAKEYDRSGCGRTDSVLVQEQTRWDFTLYNLKEHTWNVKKQFPRSIIELEEVEVAGSCRGLVCMAGFYAVDAPIYLWNPSVMKVRLLPQGENLVEKGMETAAFGLGLISKTYQYQLLRILCATPDEMEKPLYQVQVFSVSSNAWSLLPQMLGRDKPIHFWSPYGVYVDDYVYWALQHKGEREILSYDMVNRTFTILPLPNEDAYIVTHWFAGVCRELPGSFFRMETHQRVESCEVYCLGNMRIWHPFDRLLKISPPPILFARPLGYTTHGHNTGIYNEKTSSYQFSLLVETDKVFHHQTSDISVFPGRDKDFFVDEYMESLQLL